MRNAHKAHSVAMHSVTSFRLPVQTMHIAVMAVARFLTRFLYRCSCGFLRSYGVLSKLTLSPTVMLASGVVSPQARATRPKARAAAGGIGPLGVRVNTGAGIGCFGFATMFNPGDGTSAASPVGTVVRFLIAMFNPNFPLLPRLLHTRGNRGRCRVSTPYHRCRRYSRLRLERVGRGVLHSVASLSSASSPSSN